MKLLQNSGVPIYQQISDQLKADILAGKLKEAEGLVTAAPGKGFYVNAQDSEMLREQHLRRVEEALLEAIHAADIAGMTDAELQSTLQTLLGMRA